MTILTPVTIAGYAMGAGWSGQDVITATAVALAESGGNTNARNTSGGADARGLWQVNVGPAAHPDMASLNLYDPAINAKAAHSIQVAQGWHRAFQAYGGLRYYGVLPAATAGAALASPLGGAGAQLINGALQPGYSAALGTTAQAVDAATATAQGALKQAAAVSGFLQDLADPAVWLRVLKVGVGAVLILVGVQIAAQRVVMPAVAPLVGPVAAVARKAI